MIQTINQGQFIDAFRAMGRETQFSYGALCALFDYLNEHEGCGTIGNELDVIALCCTFTEFSSVAELNEFYKNGDNFLNIEEIEHYTTVIRSEKGPSFLIYNF